MKTKPETETVVEAQRAATEIAVSDFESAEWELARPVWLTRYWSGAEAPPERHAEARLLWTQEALVVRFVCRQAEPLVVAEHPRMTEKTIGLWDRDVCEIFVAPDAAAPERYLEFEAAPTGEWLDLAIHTTPEGRNTDWEFRSGMTAAARVLADEVSIAMRIPWAALRTPATHAPAHASQVAQASAPQPGELWRVNLFRCVGAGDTRGYLAWQPTLAAEPSFHVPERFGWLLWKG